MDISGIKLSEMVFSLDIGTRSVIGTVGIVRDKKFHVICESYIEHKERAMIDGQIHDITLVANAVEYVKRELENKLGVTLKYVAIAAAGRFLRTSIVKEEIEIDNDSEITKEVIMSLEVSSVKKAEDDINRQSQGKLYCVGYSVKNYYLNGYIINNLLSHKGDNISAEVIATFLPRSVVDSLYAVMERVKLTVVTLTLEPIAAMEAAIPQNLRLLNLALVDIGAGTSDIAISSKDSISAYGMVPLAGDEVTEAIAQGLLIDFNSAEKIKREFLELKSIKYTDVLGLDNEISKEDILAIIKPIVDKISYEIAAKIIELNGGKAPNALFLVGGGSHTYGLQKLIGEKLGLAPQRVAIKGRDSIVDCICEDNSLGSTGVTVIGIALVCIKRLGHDFINVILNGSTVSLFNSRKQTVLDVMIQSGTNPKVLMAKNGKNIRFTLNNSKKVAYGALSIEPKITINGAPQNVEGLVKEGDKIEIVFAKDGKNAEPKVLDFLEEINSISFTVDDEIVNLEPIYIINNKRVNLDSKIKADDYVEIIYVSTLGEFKKYYKTGNEDYYLENVKLIEDYEIKEGDKIISYSKIEKTENNISENNYTESENSGIKVIVNDKNIELTGKNKFIFVDIFSYINFDLSTPKGQLMLKLNNMVAGYYDELKSGDIIKIYWEGL